MAYKEYYNNGNKVLRVDFNLNDFGYDLIQLRIYDKDPKTRSVVRDSEISATLKLKPTVIKSGPNPTDKYIKSEYTIQHFLDSIDSVRNEKSTSAWGIEYNTYSDKYERLAFAFDAKYGEGSILVFMSNEGEKFPIKKHVFCLNAEDLERLIRDIKSFSDPDKNFMLHMVTSSLSSIVKDSINTQLRGIIEEQFMKLKDRR